MAQDEDQSSQAEDTYPEGQRREPWWDDPVLEAARVRVQVGIILSELEGSAAYYAPDRPGEPLFLYMQGRILVRDVDLDRVRDVVPGRVLNALINGVTAYEPTDGDVITALETIDIALGEGVATPDHVFYVSKVSGCCPATEPDAVTGIAPYPSPRVGSGGDGQGALVTVVDTGFIPSLADFAHPWLAGVTGDEEFFDPTDIGPYVGHGTFIAGVLRGVAPAAEVVVKGFLTHGGAIEESQILLKLNRALDLMPDVISMSAGCKTRHSLPPLAFEVLYERRLRHSKGTVLVVAAGNDHSREPFWPAAFEWTVSVGALNPDGTRAGFSNHGSWVDVYALGVDMINAYPNGTYHYKEPPRVGQTAQFTNALASWSGTSFSTPLVAGMIAARISHTGQSGIEAAESILRIARGHATPGVGAVAEAGMAFDRDPVGP